MAPRIEQDIALWMLQQNAGDGHLNGFSGIRAGKVNASPHLKAAS
jgi:hypothetical protein